MIGVDLFAGCGGFTLAAESVGVKVRFAANHWDLAVRVHAANHPEVQHAQQDLRQFDFATLEPFDILLAGPACQGHSSAGRSGRKKSVKVQAEHRQLRSTAWAVIDCLEVCRPKFAVIENVPEFRSWALLPEWLSAMKRLGYAVTQQVLNAARFGVPQRRRRIFFVAAHERAPIEVSEPNAAEPGLWSVFDEDASGWLPIEDMRVIPSKVGKPTAQDRVRAANERLGGRLGWGQHVNSPSTWGRPMDAPVTTLTTLHGQHWWVRDGYYRLWNTRERKAAMSFPKDYDLCGATKCQAAKLLGNAVPPLLAAGVIGQVLRQA